MGPGQPLRRLQPQHPTPVRWDADTQEDQGREQNGECVQAGVGVGGGAAPRRMRRTAGGARPQSKVPEAWWGGESSVGGTATGEVTWWGDPVGRKPRWGAVWQEARRNLEGWPQPWTAAGEAERRAGSHRQEERQHPSWALNGGCWSGLGTLGVSRCVWNRSCVCVPASSVHGRQHPLQTSLPSAVLP